MKLINCLFIFTLNLFLSTSVISAEEHYTLGAGDKIQIHVYGEPELSFEELFISSNGIFDYPYLGQIQSLNKTTQQLKEEITLGLKGDYLIEPKVMVSVLSFRKIYINGEVKNPGGYEYQPGLTIDKAIALAGGFTDRAAKSSITITNNASGIQSKKTKLTKSVRPGDIITIEESFF
ncbi:polysaccharide biosynthesis/export family protein [Vibrio sp. YMD68]|uniref:polysaccharide biosynthesis/export family protein n=1 Tax=Vibrio sp. YMD68 TaxID=3042300 RepID=UPI00249ACF31|nr:polysaccharide biosynthesis/export family protein [Vibrio sp. YMD68]WGV98429.1 polysaccharide biosynthesis/export family protein [Vibrio sp. YMD68]